MTREATRTARHVSRGAGRTASAARIRGRRVGLFSLFRWACVALAAETVAWVVALAL